MRAEIISVGTELLLGEITDTNASFLASQLPYLGIDLYWISQVGDNRTRLVEVLTRAWQRSDLVLLTGGLGPTDDDITRDAIADILKEKPSVDPLLEKELRSFFSRRGIAMPVTNIKQATLIPSAKAIGNIRGTAPGWWIEKDGRIMIAMPGPPGEMRHMWCQDVLPRLRKCANGTIIVSRTIKTFGLGESAVGERITNLLANTNPTLGIYAKSDGIHLRITAKAPNKKQADEMLSLIESDVDAIMAKYIWGKDDDSLELVVGEILKKSKSSLAVMEGYSGGLLAATITQAPDSDLYFKGGLIACSSDALIAFGIDNCIIAKYGIASVEVVKAMAHAGRLHLRSDIGIGVTCSDNLNAKEKIPFSSIYVAIDDGNNRRIFTDSFPGNRDRIKRRLVCATLFELRRMLLNIN